MSHIKLSAWALTPILLLSTAALAQPAHAPAQMTTAEVEKTIRAYLLANPEIIIEMSQIIKRKQAEEKQVKSQAELAKHQAELTDAASPSSGPDAGNAGVVTIVEFFDYRCGYCKRVNPVLQKLMHEDPTIRLVFKELPILGPESTAASLAALAANRQGGYLKLHHALMSAKNVTPAEVERIAQDAGLDAGRMRKDIASPEVTSELERNRALAEALSIEATPAFVIGNQIVPGAMDEPAFRRLIENARMNGGRRAGR